MENKNSFDILEERGFLKQCSNKEDLKKTLTSSNIYFYVGFDPTADSLHIGSLALIMASAYLQKGGHKPLVLVGEGTGLIGDPSGKTELRAMLSKKDLKNNSKKISSQIKKYLDLRTGKGSLINNDKWLSKINYVDFLREFGKYFRVNEMIKREGYRLRLEREEGLSFLEFNYQIFQAYDFLVLSEKYNCILQIGGDDQWGNILAGVDLVKKVEQKEVFALTIPLLRTSSGDKMGKTEKGAVWLDEKKTSPYEFYQYWINVDDKDVSKFLKIYTFVEIEKIQELERLEGKDSIKAKEILAFEVTKLCHGEKKALEAQVASKSLFSKESNLSDASVPKYEISREQIEGLLVADLFAMSGLVESKSAARRLIQQGGAYVNDKKVSNENETIDESMFKNNEVLLRHGKKHYIKVLVK